MGFPDLTYRTTCNLNSRVNRIRLAATAGPPFLRKSRRDPLRDSITTCLSQRVQSQYQLIIKSRSSPEIISGFNKWVKHDIFWIQVNRKPSEFKSQVDMGNVGLMRTRTSSENRHPHHQHAFPRNLKLLSFDLSHSLRRHHPKMPHNIIPPNRALGFGDFPGGRGVS